MNRGVLQSSPVQQMMTGNLNWWNINNMRPPPQQPSHLLPPTSSPLFPQYPPPTSLPLGSLNENQDLPEQSWSQLLLGGLVGEEDRCSFSHLQAKKMESCEEPMLFSSSSSHIVDVKQERSESGYGYGHGNEEYQAVRSPWGQVLPASSPRSCVTGFSSNILDFASSKVEGSHPQPDHSPEYNSTVNGPAFKKAKVQSSAHSTFKVRKEKLGDRITALHQLVSPFGKTDTASVLLEAIGYIRFLQSQIEALSSPYMASGSGSMKQPDAKDEPKKDLRSRGLCLVPVSCTLQVGSDNGADYWAPTLGGGFR
ncbi:transcription factor bHLH68-like protein [Cinnamomum micranthum f. kanehirae]|uniref:Transcription factor bHLH68-like protein n=1 Tax=Cinnamomum micranthum f. kanehirae TaxID=337451 RepID=A0A443N4K1_9MAGN|nr:transcription factor bHLH68-like protein [Cinnamomum micranthum f. kanehirae]